MVDGGRVFLGYQSRSVMLRREREVRSPQGGKGETPVLRITGGVQAEYSGVQADYVKYGGVLEYRSLAFSPLVHP